MTATTRRDRRQQGRRPPRAASCRGVSQVWVALGVVALLAALVVIGRATGAFEPAPTAAAGVNGVDASGPKVGERREDLGAAHVASGTRVSYPAVPPTSGGHYGSPAAPTPWGIKTTFLPFEVTTHNLEHGGVVMMYRDLTGDEVTKLQALARDLSGSGFPKIVLEPYPDLQGGKIALTAWNWVLQLPAYDETTIVKFVRQHHGSAGEAPEPTAG